MKKVLVFTATYNESSNIYNLVSEISNHLADADILVIDDNSPDGTGDILDRISMHDRRVKVIHRTGKLGLGSAHIQGMQYAVKNDYDILVTMDADFSHNPKYLTQLIGLMDRYDFVIGSRYMNGGGSGYGMGRTFVSKTANFLCRHLLSIKLRECTTSYRGFRKELLEKILKSNISSTGYSFFFETVYIVSRLTPNIAEFPIYFADRTRGESKISRTEITKGVLTLFKLSQRRLSGR